MNNYIPWIVGAAGVAVVGGLVWKYKTSGSLGRPRLVAPPTRKNGMTVRHYRGRMPIEDRIALLQDLVLKGVQDPEMRKLALSITRHCPERDGLCEAKAIYDWMKSPDKNGVPRIRYTGDVAPIALGANGAVEGIDFYQSAKRTIEFGGGDCDDHDVVGATLLALNGIPPKFRVTAGGHMSDWGHIYALAGLPKNNPKKWIPMDTTLPGNNNFGKEAPYAKFKDFAA